MRLFLTGLALGSAVGYSQAALYQDWTSVPDETFDFIIVGGMRSRACGTNVRD